MILSIELLRGVAALLVVYLHASNGYFGACGVDIFFVISGFVMSLVVDRGEVGFHFIRNRLIRIVPSYWFLTFILFAAAQFLPFAVKSSVSSSDLFNSLLFIPFLKSSGAIQPVLNVGWSLNYEMLFYVLIFVSSLFIRKHVIYSACILLLIVCISSRYSHSYVISNFYGDSILIEFLYGCFVYRFKDIQFLKTVGLHVRFSIAALIFAGFYVLEVWNGVAFRPFTMGVLAALLLFVILTFEDELNKSPKAVKKFASMSGRISYSLYLTHPFAIGLLYIILNRYILLDTMESTFVVIFIVLVTVVFSYIFYIAFDRPTYKLLKNVFQKK